jgi:hypothetical protein
MMDIALVSITLLTYLAFASQKALDFWSHWYHLTYYCIQARTPTSNRAYFMEESGDKVSAKLGARYET